MSPRVSVVIPTFNRDALLPRAIQSVVRQTFTDWEIVLVDDGSTDGTPALAQEYGRNLSGRFTYARQPRGGSSAARNRGIDVSRGEFVAFLDSDDEFLPTKIAKQVELFDRRPQLGLVYSNFSFVDFEGRIHDSAFDEKFPLAREIASEEIAPGLHVCAESLFETLIRGYFIATIVGMVRRELLGDDLRFAQDVRYAEEWLFFLDVAKRCAAGFVDESLSRHHYVANSLARESKSRNSLAQFGLLMRVADQHGASLTASQRDHLGGRAAMAARQLAFDAIAGGDFEAAAGRFLDAVRWQPGSAAIRDLANFAMYAVLGRVRRGKRPSAAEPAGLRAGGRNALVGDAG